MKNLIISFVMLLMFVQATSVSVHAQDLLKKANPEKEIFYGCSDNKELFSRFPEAVATAIMEYALLSEEVKRSSTSTQNHIEATGEIVSKCSIRLLDFKDTGDMTEVLVQVMPEGDDYTYAIQHYHTESWTEGKNSSKSMMEIGISSKDSSMSFYMKVIETDKQFSRALMLESKEQR